MARSPRTATTAAAGHAVAGDGHGGRRRRRRALAFAPAPTPAPVSAPASTAPAHHRHLRCDTVVVTGGTRGVGLALAREFLARGHCVAVCGRDAARVDAARTELAALAQRTAAPAAVHAEVCDVGDAESLARFARDCFPDACGAAAAPDIWVNNAGTTGGKRRPLHELDAHDVSAVVRTNLLGTLLGSREAIRRMRTAAARVGTDAGDDASDSGGNSCGHVDSDKNESEKTATRRGTGTAGWHIFNTDGAGVFGNATRDYAPYGATKRAIPQLTASLNAELAGTAVRVHTISPGMVLTDLLLAESTPRTRQFFNLLAEEPRTAAAFLVPRMLAAARARRRGRYIRFHTLPSAFATIAARAVAQNVAGRRPRFFDARGDRI